MSDLRLLLIEDHAPDADLLRSMLAKEGADIDLEWVQTLDDGVQAMTKGSFDAILLDLSLPDSQGIESVATTHLFDSETPIIVLTGLNDDDAAFEALRAGAQDYLVKGEIDGRGIVRSVRFAKQRNEVQRQMGATPGLAAQEDVQMAALCCAPGASIVGTIAAYLAKSAAAGQSILYVTVDRPGRVLAGRFGDAGVPTDSLHVIDASGNDDADDAHIHAVAADDLEGLAVEIECAIAALGGGAMVVVDSINSLILHHTIDAAAVFAHTLANRCRLLGVPVDFVGHRTQEWPYIMDRFSFLDGEVHLGDEEVVSDTPDPSVA